MRSLLSRIGAEDLPRDSAMCGEGNVATFSNVSYLNEFVASYTKGCIWSTSTQAVGFFGAVFTNLCAPALRVGSS
jgi:hypothetical protein